MGKLYAALIAFTVSAALADQWQRSSMLACLACVNGRGGFTRCEPNDDGIGCHRDVMDKLCDGMNLNCKCYEARNGCPCTMAYQ